MSIGAGACPAWNYSTAIVNRKDSRTMCGCSFLIRSDENDSALYGENYMRKYYAYLYTFFIENIACV